MNDKKAQIIPLNSEINSGVSIEELEDRLEMQLIGLMDALALSQVTTTNCPDVHVVIPDPL